MQNIKPQYGIGSETIGYYLEILSANLLCSLNTVPTHEILEMKTYMQRNINTDNSKLTINLSKIQ